VADLQDFFNPDHPADTLIGTYLYPNRLFMLGLPNLKELPEVIHTEPIDGLDVLVTRNGGLFVHPPPELLVEEEAGDGFRAKLNFEERAAGAFNKFICELALEGIPFEPTSPAHIARGRGISNSVLITSTGGSYTDRTIGPGIALIRGTVDWSTMTDPLVLVSCTGIARAQNLSGHSPSLPTLIAGAYSNYSRRSLAEAMLDGWIVIEQLVDDLWQQLVVHDTSGKRRQRLTGYSVAIRIDVLESDGVIATPLAETLQEARGHRNDLAHRALVTLDATRLVMQAMKDFLDVFVPHGAVAAPQLGEWINW
jgi:hypothetical protein